MWMFSPSSRLGVWVYVVEMLNPNCLGVLNLLIAILAIEARS
jgi:hypothetical protein